MLPPNFVTWAEAGSRRTWTTQLSNHTMSILTRRQLGRSRTSGVSRTCVTDVPTQHGTFVAPATRSSALGADRFTPSVHHRRNVSHKCNHDSRNTSGNLTATGRPITPTYTPSLSEVRIIPRPPPDFTPQRRSTTPTKRSTTPVRREPPPSSADMCP